MLRWLAGREPRAALAERLVLGSAPAGNGPRPVWVHAASVGEAAAARPVIEALLAETGRPVCMTVNTVTARQAATGWGLDGLSVRLAPVDSQAALRRFFRKVRPALLVNLEAEFWPHRFAMCRARAVPAIGLGTKLSDRAARRSGYVAELASGVLSAFSEIWPLDEPSRGKLLAAGAAPGSLRECFNAKFIAVAPAAERTPWPEALSSWQGDPVVLAASAHAGEEGVLVAAFAAARSAKSRLRLVLAPRHPAESDDFIHALAARGLRYAQRSLGQAATAETAAYIADTFSEMPLWYDACPVTIVCGTFLDRGGHTPVEPVRHGSLPIHGPDTANHEMAFAALHRADAAVLVRNEKELCAALLEAVSDPRLNDRAEAGKRAIAGLQDAMRQRLRTISLSVAGLVRDQQ